MQDALLRDLKKTCGETKTYRMVDRFVRKRLCYYRQERISKNDELKMIIPWSTGALEHHANGVQGLVHGSGRLCEILGMTGKSNRKGKYDGDVGGISAAKISKTGDSM